MQALIDCEMLSISIDDLEKVRSEFSKVFTELFCNTHILLKKQIDIKNEAIKLCEQ